MASIAFLGLGQMGAPMAARLLDAGHALTVWNRTTSKADALRTRGATVATTPAEAVRGAEVVVTMLSDPDALEAVLFGAEGAARELRAGAVLIDMSTVGPDAIRSIAERLTGIDVLDAPVRGSVGAAESGSLRIVVGGSEEAFDRCRAVLEAMGEPTRVGPLGAGAAAKLVNNLAGISSIAVLAEALALADRLGLDREATLEMLATSPIGSVVQNVGDRVRRADHGPNFKAALATKDLRLAVEAAASEGLELPVAEAARRRYEEAIDAGLGERDWSVLATFVTDPSAAS
jgi:3-hydroxyisobutyrate dehydrogenase-like beta-hydroxyacid dehydrogenase